jgi:1,4-alpha-glucan branching enzyme
MGAISHTGGATFRVWAPHATGVFVVGSFNDWSDTADPLVHEANGYWAADVPRARPGDEYKYLIVNGEQKFWRMDPYAREVTNSAGNSIIHDPDFDWGENDFRLSPWNELVIYEMHVGTFNDRPDGGPGSLPGVIKKLPYLQQLGVNAIQLMPAGEFPGGFSWGYNPAHVFAIERDYGGPKTLKALVKAAHAHGIAVIMDVVYNHWGPGDLSLWQFDGWHENGQGGIYFYNDWRAQTPWGDTRPDYGRGEVRQYIRDNVFMWLAEYRVDGLRWDATAFVRNVHGNEMDPANDLPEGWSLMQWLNDEIKTHHPGKITIAEDLRGNAWIVKDTGAGGAGFGAQWTGNFVHPVRTAIISRDDAFRDMHAVRDALYPDDEDAFKRVIYTESHDEVANGRARVPEDIWPGNPAHLVAKKRSTLGAALIFTAPGIPMIFQGQEFLEDKWFHDQDPLDWSKTKRFSGILDMYRDLIHLRRNAHGNSGGLSGQNVQAHHVNNDTKILAFHRWRQGGPGDSVVVAVNMANRSYDDYILGLPAGGAWRVRLNSDWQRYDPEFGDHPSPDVVANEEERDGLPYSGAVSIGPYSVLILSQDK